MDQTWINRWNDRYRRPGFAYGREPNRFLKEQLDALSPGAILFPAEGEGRNAVYAATLGWSVSAFDISPEGQKKALQLAHEHKVTLDYRVGGLEEMTYLPGQFDAIALIYAHFPAAVKSQYHQSLSNFLKPGGLILFEAFSKKHLEYNTRNEQVGGPKDLASLFSIEEIRTDFPDYHSNMLKELEIELSEGLYHQGTGSVIRFVGRKK